MAGSSKFYTLRPMDYAICTSVTSEATGHPIEHALDHNLYTYWEPTSTAQQVIVLDMQNNMQERITAVADRDFSSDTGHWFNDITNGWDTWTVDSGVLSVGSAATEKYGSLATAGMSAFVAGETYRITYTWAAIGGLTAQFKCATTSQVIGTLVAGTAQTLTFTATGASTSLILETTSASGTGALDNVSIRRIDGETANAVKAFALWINNHNTYFDASHGITVEYSDDNSTWTTVAEKDIQDEMTDGGQGDALRIYVLAAAHSRRYWRLTLHDAVHVIKLGGIYLLSEFDFGAHSIYPEKTGRAYWNDKSRMDSGILAVSPGGRTPTRTLNRQYRFTAPANLTILQNAFDACRGGQTPIILNEGTEYYLVNVLTDTLDVSENDYQYYTASLDYETLPYVADGDTI